MKNRAWFMLPALMLALCVFAAPVRAAEEKEEQGEKAAKKEAVAPKLTLDQLPAAVKATVKKESKGAKIDGLEKEIEDGKTQYCVELTKGKAKFEIAIGEDGKVLAREELIALKQAPKAVQAALKKEAQGGKLGEEIEKGEKDGKPIYTANVTKGKKAYEVIFGQDGKLVEREAATEAKPAAKKSEKDDDEKGEKAEKGEKKAKADKDDDEKDEKAPAKLTLAQIPAAVKATIVRESKGSKIVAIEKENEDGKVQYSAELAKGKERSEIAVGVDGKFLGREFILTAKQVPVGVWQTMTREAAGGKLGEEIEKGKDKDKIIYTVTITGGKRPGELTVDEDGKMLKREAATETKAAAKKSEKDDDEKDEKAEKGEKKAKADKDDDEKDEKDGK